MNLSSFREVEILCLREKQRVKLKDGVIREILLALFVNRKKIATLLCTPPGLEYLALGFLLSQGVIEPEDKNKIEEIYLNLQKGFIQVKIDIPQQKLQRITSQRYIISSCGECSFYTPEFKKLNSSFQIKEDSLFASMEEFEKKSTLFKITGGNHSCGLYNKGGELEIFAEDLGRHNALDKVFGECLLRGIKTRDRFLLLSGRISWEILSKAARRSVPLLASPSAPTDLAISLADRLNITLVGFLRQQRMNIYTHPWRIIN